ncbi:hypothetical protein SLEP1_g10487 [Rubroshorea leprosula]|uniref:Pentatricopeptide repeat-containing protein n=1 Tax=Rubroshorea leprosula TaxID=152421 RepID=A0AAV5IE39_9ROSI|nr:hypothetical protein SLEP1_g10487 [Rubroshorea leprosula]
MILFPLRISRVVPKNNAIPSIISLSRFLCTSNYSVLNSLSQWIPISEKFASYLENCTDVVSLKKLHAFIFTYGLGDSIFLGSKLLNCYARFGLLAESRWVCDRIIKNNLSIWNSILVGYHRGGLYSEVLRRYSDVKQQNLGLDSSAVTFCLKSCIELGSFEFGKRVHSDALKFGLSTDGFVGSSLIGLYSKFGDIEGAAKVFDEIPERDIVVYTSMINGYAQAGDHHAYQAFDVARLMQKEQICPNRVTLVSLVQAAAELEALREGRSIHGYAFRRDMGGLDEILGTSLIDMYIKCNDPRKAACIFHQMKVRRIGSWNAMITGHLQMGQPLEALQLFHEMVEENIAPDLIALANGILCCADLRCLHEGKSIHGQIIRLGHQLDLVSATALVDMYSKFSNLIQARKLFDGMESRDAISYSVMMAGYLRSNFASEAIGIFMEMVGSAIRPKLCCILSLLAALSDLKDTRQGRCAHGYILRNGFHMNIEITNKLVYMYAKNCCVLYARQVFDRIRYKDLFSWTSIMMGYVDNEDADEAINLFRIMKRENLDHDSVTLVSLVQAFAQLGCLNLVKEVHCHLYRVPMEKEALVINSLITTYARLGKLNLSQYLFEQNFHRCLTSWNSIIAACGMHGNCIDALKLFNQMKEENIKPDEMTFTSIFSACSHSGLVKEGLQIFKSMTEEYSIIPGEEHYSCIIDLLSRAGRVEEAYDLVKLLPEKASASALGALLAACRVHGKTEMGEVIGQHLLQLSPEKSSVYRSVANIFADGGKWDDVARIRELAKKRGLKKTPGISLIEL